MNKYKDKKYYKNRRVYTRRLSNFKVLLLLLVSLIIIYKVAFTQDKHEPKQLHDQPNYAKLEPCSATLCNSKSKCTKLSSNIPYGPSSFAQDGLHLDLSTVHVSVGCQLDVKTQDEETVSLSDGQTYCGDGEKDTKCKNAVNVELKSNVLILATQLQKLMADPISSSQELSFTQPAKSLNSRKLDVTLVSQFSVNRLDVFSKVIDVWQGPISVAIYLTNPNDINQLVSYFKEKSRLELYSRVAISIIKPNYLGSNHLAYPINHLRNIAITQSVTDYIFVMDADFVPSINLYKIISSNLIPFVMYQNGKIASTAWVVPCFAIKESHSELPLPNDFNELRKLVGKDIAYITDPGAGHGPTLAIEIAMVRPLLMGNPLAYEVCYESQWEPYYVIHRSAPLYDARFRNQGGDKQSHALQLNAEKYRFMVLRETFMIHKDHSTMAWPGGGFEQSQKAHTNWNYFEGYLEEIESIYGSWARWPRGCSAEAIGWQDQRRNTLGLATGSA